MKRRFGLVALAIGAALAVSGPARADIISTYTIDVDTTGLTTQAGLIDFQFNTGNTPFDPSTATVQGFSCDCTLTGVLLPDYGDVSGSLPGTVTINNTDANNEHTEQVTFGTYFDFNLTLDTPNVSGTAAGGTTFALSVWDTNFAPLLTGDPLVTINLDATTGTPTVTNNSVDGVATVEQNTVPEPNTALLLVAIGLLPVWQLRRRRARIG